MNPTRLSKFLSLVLRHQPETIGLQLDEHGWAEVQQLIENAAAHGKSFSRAELLAVVAGSDKQRFTLSPDASRIRAAQGHSVKVDLGLKPTVPPPVLYHGTATRFLDSILAQGLKPQSRQQVHLSADVQTAVKVGARHGAPVVLTVAAERMQVAGFSFFQADNGVWLTDQVPAEFLANHSQVA